MDIHIHPLLAALPTMAERDYESLKADIAAHSLLEPVMTYRDLVTDGRGRLQACQELGVEVRTAREWEDEDAVSEEEVAARIISRTMVRAHWTAGQRAAAVLE